MAEDEVTAAAEPRPRTDSTPPEVPAVARDSRAGVVVQAAIAASVRALMTQEPQLRDGIDDEAVHRARVATRRLRSDTRTFESLLDPDWTMWTLEELRWLGERLGRARDADVLLARIDSVLERLPLAHVDREVLLSPLISRRHAARRAVRQTMRTRRYGQLLDTLADAARTPPLRGSASAAAKKVLPRLVDDRWRALRREVRRAGKAPASDQLHTIRIRAKRARYAAEAVSPALGAPARRFAKRMEELQEFLGRHHDAAVAGAWLRDVARDADPGVAFLAGEVAGLEDAELAAIARAWPTAWKRARPKRYREWF
jgi:CHAD domain-containing protein